MAGDPDWEERVRAEAKIHAEAQSDERVKNLGLGCLILIYIFACIVFPPLLLAIPVVLIVMFFRAKPRPRGGS